MIWNSKLALFFFFITSVHSHIAIGFLNQHKRQIVTWKTIQAESTKTLWQLENNSRKDAQTRLVSMPHGGMSCTPIACVNSAEWMRCERLKMSDLVSGVVMEMAGRVRRGSVVGRCRRLAVSDSGVRQKVRGGTMIVLPNDLVDPVGPVLQPSPGGSWESGDPAKSCVKRRED